MCDHWTNVQQDNLVTIKKKGKENGSSCHGERAQQTILWWVYWGVFDMPALEGLASEPGSGQPELGPERPGALFDVFAPTEPG
jgi:hypothetical protein